MNTKELKTFRTEFKAEGDDGTFSGYLSVYGNVDSQNEVVDRGAMKRTLERWKQKGKPVPLLWMHGREGLLPIGSMDPGEMKDDDYGLEVRGKLLLGIQQAREVYECLKAGVADGMSIGFKTLKDRWEKGVRHLEEIRLFEGSIVLAGANELALVRTVKAGDEDEAKDAVSAFAGVAALAGRLQEALASALPEGPQAAWADLAEVRGVVDAIAGMLWALGEPEEVGEAMAASLAKVENKSAVVTALAARLGIAPAPPSESRDTAPRQPAVEVPAAWTKALGELQSYTNRRA